MAKNSRRSRNWWGTPFSFLPSPSFSFLSLFPSSSPSSLPHLPPLPTLLYKWTTQRMSTASVWFRVWWSRWRWLTETVTRWSVCWWSTGRGGTRKWTEWREQGRSCRLLRNFWRFSHFISFPFSLKNIIVHFLIDPPTFLSITIQSGVRREKGKRKKETEGKRKEFLTNFEIDGYF